MGWDGRIETLPMVTVRAGSRLFHGTDCDGDFEIPDGPAWFAAKAEEAAYWAGWNVPVDGRSDGERRYHAYETTVDLVLVDFDLLWVTDEDWERLCLVLAGEEDELTRNELTRNEVADAMARRGMFGWRGQCEVMLTRPAESLRFIGRTSVPGSNGMRPRRSTWVAPAAGCLVPA